jgi:hypothetical protein
VGTPLRFNTSACSTSTTKHITQIKKPQLLFNQVLGLYSHRNLKVTNRYSSDCDISTSMSLATELLLNIALIAIIITAKITVVSFNPREDELFIILPILLSA